MAVHDVLLGNPAAKLCRLAATPSGQQLGMPSGAGRNPRTGSAKACATAQRRALGAPLLHGRPLRVGHAATYPFAYEIFGKEERTAMTYVDSQTVQCHLCGCLIAVVTDASENTRPERSHITHSVELSWPAMSQQTFWAATKCAKRGCAQCAHPGPRIGWYRRRTGPDCGGSRGSGGFQGLEPGSSPTSGTCFPCSGACGPLSVHKLFTYGPLRGFIFVGGRLPPFGCG